MKEYTRIYVDDKLQKSKITLNRKQSHYLKNVMRVSLNDRICIFNEADGEWTGVICLLKKNCCEILIDSFSRSSDSFYDVWLLFAPVKQARLDYLAQKSCEMGVKKLWPIFTEYTQVKNININRIKSNLIEAAEQCGLTSIPSIADSKKFDHILSGWDNIFDDRRVIFCDERSSTEVFEALNTEENKEQKKWAIIIGPEGGFSDSERSIIKEKNNSIGISLGPRVLRSDTAVVAALAAFQMIIGDWNN